jgi:methionyl-tRNA formyltransferase
MKPNTPLRIVFFGMRCAGSPPVLRELLSAGYDVRAVIRPGVSTDGAITRLAAPVPIGQHNIDSTATFVTVPLFQASQSLDAIAQSAGVPLFAVGDLKHQSVAAEIERLEPDLIAVSCFPARLPRKLLAIPRFGGLNVHPSLLPRGRGADPIFWTFRNGDRESGVTIHLMDDGFDTGPILLQESVNVPAGISMPAFEEDLTLRGARLLCRAIEGLAVGKLVPRPQDSREATRAPRPTTHDYLVDSDRPAVWAYNFVKAMIPLEQALPLRIKSGGVCFSVLDAIDCSAEGSISSSYLFVEVELLVQFIPGTVRFRVAASN